MAHGHDGAPSPELEQVLGGAELAWLRERVRLRLERGFGLDAEVQFKEPSGEQVTAVARLLGRRLKVGKVLRVRLADVSVALARAGLAADVGQAVQVLDGPVENRSAASAARESAWQEALVGLDAAAAVRPVLKDWVAWIHRRGLVRSLASEPEAGRALVDEVVAVLSRLPHPGLRLPRLAREVLGSAHGLDDGRPAGTLVLSAIPFLMGGPESRDQQDLEQAEARRESWAAVGVLVGDLTTTVLVLNLPGGGEGVSDRILNAGAAVGEPVLLSLGQLTRHPPDLQGMNGRVVYVCENETVVGEAADRLGGGTAALICGRGQPTVAVMRLLQQLRQDGCSLRYHGDFDWPGIRIGNRVMRRLAAMPWRYSSDDYLVAAPGARSPLGGAPADALWDPRLRPAMEEAKVQVEEEDVLDDLLADLRRSVSSSLPRR